MKNQDALDNVFRSHGFNRFSWINAADIVVAQWVRVKCMFGCWEYGQSATCPPNVPSVEECERFFREYEDAVLFHFPKTVPDPQERYEWSKQVDLDLVQVEREVFLAGYRKAFLLAMGSCSLCAECTKERDTCKNMKSARPTAEAFAVDLFATVQKYGYPIKVVEDYDEEMNRYAILLIQ
jgi:predicted metal-binding protein